jgi:hypothetical protein
MRNVVDCQSDGRADIYSSLVAWRAELESRNDQVSLAKIEVRKEFSYLPQLLVLPAYENGFAPRVVNSPDVFHPRGSAGVGLSWLRSGLSFAVDSGSNYRYQVPLEILDWNQHLWRRTDRQDCIMI